jgi:hypothetical protein
MANRRLIARHATWADRYRAGRERYTPSLPLALALARYFGVTVEEMFDDQGS